MVVPDPEADVTRTLDILRHAEDDDDVLTPGGVAAAVGAGRGRLHGGYAVVATSGAQRATQTAACLVAGLGEPVGGGVVVVPGFRSTREDEWRAAYRAAGSGHLDALRSTDPALVDEDTRVLADALRGVVAVLDDGARALVVGHSPTSEAAVLGLTGEVVDPFGRLEGVVVAVGDDGDARVVARLA